MFPINLFLNRDKLLDIILFMSYNEGIVDQCLSISSVMI